MTYLLLAIASSLGIGVIFKVASLRQVARVPLLAVNYLVAALIGVGLVVSSGSTFAPSLNAQFLLFALSVGGLLIGSFFLFALATDKAGMSITMAVMRTGVSIPFLVSWMAWGEIPSVAQWIGFGLVVGALVFLTQPTGGKGTKRPDGASILLLLAVFLGGGLGDLSFKAFDVWFAPSVDGHVFLVFAFGLAFLVSVVLLARRAPGDRFPRRDAWMVGLLLGGVNYASILFVLGAVARLPAIVVFPTISVSVVVGGAVLGVVIWRERLSPTNLVGIGLAAASVLLLKG
ncbi:MAG: drug/metabolite transporter (DMT)-like permease [Rhodothermales bacterium]|jgi:drug/metabolite transporter (DMT)-like permease